MSETTNHSDPPSGGTPATPPPKPLRPPGLAYDVMPVLEAAAVLGCKRSKAFMLIRDGILKVVRMPGRLTCVTRKSVEDEIARRLGQSPRARRRMQPRRDDGDLDAAFDEAIRA